MTEWKLLVAEAQLNTALAGRRRGPARPRPTSARDIQPLTDAQLAAVREAPAVHVFGSARACSLLLETVPAALATWPASTPAK